MHLLAITFILCFIAHFAIELAAMKAENKRLKKRIHELLDSSIVNAPSKMERNYCLHCRGEIMTDSGQLCNSCAN